MWISGECLTDNGVRGQVQRPWGRAVLGIVGGGHCDWSILDRDEERKAARSDSGGLGHTELCEHSQDCVLIQEAIGEF